MATVAKLVMEIEAQFKRTGLAEANRAVRTFSSQIDKAFRDIPTLASIGGAGGKLLTASFEQTKKEFLRQADDLRAQFKRRRITGEEMFGGIEKAASEAVKSVRDATFTIRGFTETVGGRQVPLISGQQAESAVRAMEAIGKRTSEALVAGSRSTRAGQKILDNLEKEFNSAEATRFVTRALGGSTRKEFENQGKLNAAAFDAGLAKAMQDLASKGKLTEPLRQAFAKSFKTEGFGFGDAASAAEKSLQRAQRVVEVLTTRMNQTVLRNQEKLASGAISPEAFERRAFLAAQAFDRGLATAAGRMRAAGNLGVEASSLISKSFLTVGRRTADAGVFAAREYVANFRDTFERAMLAARLGSRTGELTKSQFRAASDDAAKNFAKGLKDVTDRLEREGLLTPAARAFINRQLAGTGTQAGKTFFEAFDIAMSDSSIKSLSRFGTLASQVGQTLTKFLTLPLAGAGAASVKLAGDFQQAGKRLEIAFGPASVQLERNLNRLQTEIPATSTELRQMAARLGELIIPLGLSSQATAQMATELIKITKNISLFAGVDTERSFNAVINGLVGQTRELKKLGVEIDDRTIRDRAYRDGLARVGSQLSTTTKVMAGYRVLLDRTRLIEGVLAQSQDTFNVRLLFFSARLREVGITLGTAVLPFLTRMVIGLTQLFERMTAMTESTKRWVIGLGIAAATIGPVLIALGSLARSIALFRAVLLTLETTGAVAAGGGLLGALGLAGFAAQAAPVILAIGAITAAILAYKAATGTASDEMVEFQKEIAGLEKDDLEHVRRNLQLSIERLKQERQSLILKGNIQPLRTPAPPSLLGGLIDNPFGTVKTAANARTDVERFNELGRQIETTQQKVAGITKELEKVAQAEAVVNRGAAEYAARAKEAMKSANTELIVEELHRLTQEYSQLTIRAQGAAAALTKARVIQDPKKIEEATNQAQNIVSELGTLAERFNTLSLMPENAPLRKEIADLIVKTTTAKDRLEAFILRAQSAKALTEFAGRVAEIRKQMELGARTGNIEQIDDAFKKAAELATEVQEKLKTATQAANGNTDSRAFLSLHARLSAILLDLALMQDKFKGLIPTELFQQIDDVTSRLKAMKEAAPEGVVTSTGVPQAGLREQQRNVLQLIQLQDELNRKVAASAAAGFPTDELKKKLLEVTKTIRENTPNLFEVLFGDDFIPRIEEVSAALRSANFAEQTAEAFGDAGAKAAASLQKAFAEGMKGRLFADLQAQLSQLAGVTPKIAADIIQQFQEAFNKGATGAGNLNERLSKTELRFRNILLLTEGLRSIADAFGFADKNVGRLITSTGLLLQGLTQFIQKQREVDQAVKQRQERARGAGASDADIAKIGQTFAETMSVISAAIGAAGAIVGIFKSISSLFGRSDLDREHDAILKENNAKLAEMTSALDGFTGSVADLSRVSAALSDPLVLKHGRVETTFNAFAARFGVTFGDLKRAADKFGIDIFDKNGNIVAGALLQLRDAIEISRKAMLKYSETLEDQQKKLELFNNVFNIPDTGAQQIQDQLGLLSSLAPDLFKQFFSGVDLSNATDVEQALQLLTRALLSGALEANETFKLLSRDELEQIITGVADGLDKLRDATDDLTESVLNVPEWFKVAQVRFESVAAQIPDIPTRPPTTTTPPIQTDANPTPPNIKARATETRTLSSEAVTTKAVSADVLNVTSIRIDNPPTFRVQVPNGTTVSADVKPIPPITANVSVPPIDPVRVQLDVPNVGPVKAELAKIPDVVLRLPDEPVVAQVTGIPSSLPIKATVADIPPVTLDLPDAPIVAKVDIPTTIALDARVADIPPITLDIPDRPIKATVDVPKTVALDATVSDLPPVVLSLPDTPVVAKVDIPPTIGVNASVGALPPVILDLPDTPIVASVTGIPDEIALTASLDTIPPVVLDIPKTSIEADVTLPRSVPVSATIDDIPPVVLDLPDRPIVATVTGIPSSIPIDASIPDLPPVRFALPDEPLVAKVNLPSTIAVDATVSNLPPVVLDLPDKPVVARVTGIPDVIPVTATFDTVPPVTLDLPDRPVVAELTGIPDSVPVTATIGELPPVVLDVPNASIEARVDLPATLPVTATIDDVPTVTLDLPDTPIVAQVTGIPASVPIRATVADLPPVTLALPTDPIVADVRLPSTITVDATIDQLPPVVLDLPDKPIVAAVTGIPRELSVAASVESIPPVVIDLPTKAITAKVDLPSSIPVTASIEALPPVVLDLPDRPVVAELSGIPDSIPVEATIGALPPVVLDVPDAAIQARVDIPSSIPVTATVEDIPAVVLDLPNDPVVVSVTGIPDSVPVRATLADLPPVVLALPADPVVADVRLPSTIAVDATVDQIPPVVLDLPTDPVAVDVDIPRSISLAAKIDELPPVTLRLPDTPIVAQVDVPPTIGVNAQIGSLPPVILDLPDKPVVASITGIPDTVSVTATLGAIPPVVLDIPTTAVQADVEIPRSIPVEATIDSIPPVVLDLPDDPIVARVDTPDTIALTATVGTLPPVELVLPSDPITVAVPPIAPIEATIAAIPPITLDLPDDPIEAQVDIPTFVNVRALIENIPPVELKLPSDPIPVDVPPIQPLKVLVDSIPPVELKLPDDPIVLQPLRIDSSDIKLTSDSVGVVEAPDRVSLRPPATGAALSPIASSGGDDNSVTVNGPLIGQVVQQPGESTEELAVRIMGQFRREKFNRTGTTRIPGFDD